MKKVIYLVFAMVLSQFLVYSSVQAGSEVSYPADWKSWTSVSTILTKIGALPGCDADVKSFPLIYQETVSTYCALRKDGPGKVEILVKPSVVDTFKARNGKFQDGSNMILHLKDMKALFISGHKDGNAVYAVYTEDGKDITAASGPLAASTCRTCHTGYSAFCINGQCGKIQ